MNSLQITCRGMALSPALRTLIRNYASHLESFYPRIMRCEVTISRPHRHKRKGTIYHVNIHLLVPGRDLVVSREAEADHSHEHLQLALHDSFRAIERRLEDQVRRMRGEVKTLSPRPRARIFEAVPDLDYGLLETSDGREIYFHRNSLKGSVLEELTKGDEVSFREESGEQGPQATFVQLARRARRPNSKARRKKAVS